MAELRRFPMLQKLFQGAVCLGLMLATIGSLLVAMLTMVFSDQTPLAGDVTIYGFVVASTLVSATLSFRMVRGNAYQHRDAIALLIIVVAWSLIF